MKKIMITVWSITLLISTPTHPESVGKSKKNLRETLMKKNSRVTLPSGLQYEIITAIPDNAAVMPKKGSTVSVHYTGWLADANGNPIESKKFDSSVDRKQPFSFVVGIKQVIAGWDEGILLMKKGEKRRLIIPANLAYGARSVSTIPANSTLVFDVELLEIQ